MGYREFVPYSLYIEQTKREVSLRQVHKTEELIFEFNPNSPSKHLIKFPLIKYYYENLGWKYEEI